MGVVAEEKKEFKKTEVGWIPEDWNINKFGELVSIRNQKVFASYNLQGLVCIDLEHIAPADGNLLLKRKESSSKSIKYRFYPNDVLFGRLRPYLRKYWLSDCEGICSTEIWPFIVNQNKAHSIFVYSVIQSNRFIEAASISYGTHMPRADWDVLSALDIALPTLKEQEAIAEALSDVDDLIRSLDALIEKKQAIKKGAMQQLLTGKKRLPGFSGEWEVKKLGDIGKFCSGNGFPLQHQGDLGGKYPFFKVSDMNNKGNQVIFNYANNYISETTRKKLNSKVFPSGSIVFAKIGAAIFLERKRYLIRPSCIDNNLMAFVFDTNSYNVNFIYSLFLNTKIGELANTTALPSLSSKDISKIVFIVPGIQEQKAIAEVLSNIDNEIQALQKKRDKYKQIKQGMMQELLTGKTRLI